MWLDLRLRPVDRFPLVCIGSETSGHFAVQSEVKVNVGPLCYPIRSKTRTSCASFTHLFPYFVSVTFICLGVSISSLDCVPGDWLKSLLWLKVQYVTTALKSDWSSNHICNNSLFQVTNLARNWIVWIQKYLAFQNNLGRSKSCIVQKSHLVHV